jgi:hypothetical protein
MRGPDHRLNGNAKHDVAEKFNISGDNTPELLLLRLRLPMNS